MHNEYDYANIKQAIDQSIKNWQNIYDLIKRVTQREIVIDKQLNLRTINQDQYNTLKNMVSILVALEHKRIYKVGKEQEQISQFTIDSSAEMREKLLEKFPNLDEILVEAQVDNYYNAAVKKVLIEVLTDNHYKSVTNELLVEVLAEVPVDSNSGE